VEAPAGYEGGNKLEALFGPGIWHEIAGKTVLDFGCGHGHEAIEVAQRGASHVIGLDIQDRHVRMARANQAAAGVSNCTFTQQFDSYVDVILSIDSFEHFGRPEEVLNEMSKLLKPGGKVLVSFGPPWYHPKGGHFPLFVWAHLLLTEESLLKWRSKFKHDGALRFHEVAGGLNQMSIRGSYSLPWYAARWSTAPNIYVDQLRLWDSMVRDRGRSLEPKSAFDSLVDETSSAPV
jgi:SAM-dependent methyltransferase